MCNCTSSLSTPILTMRSMLPGAGLALVALLCSSLVVPALAEAPRLDSLFPAGGQLGSSFSVTPGGKLDDATRLWADDTGLVFTSAGAGKTRTWQAHVSATARPGLHLIYAVNSDGVSSPRWFSLGRLPETEEKEPNDEYDKSQKLEKLPTCVNARLQVRGDVDNYQVPLKAGQTLVAMLEGYALGSPIDPLLHVLDPLGNRVTTASDGRNLDPFIAYKAETDGLYTVQVAGFIHPPAADVKLHGGPTVVYRLHVSTGPVITHTFPPAQVRKGKTEATAIGYNLDTKNARLSLPPPIDIELSDFLFSFPQGALLPLQMLAADKAAQPEKEPNNKADQAMPIAATALYAGAISDRADVDRYALTLKKGEKATARIHARKLGLALDATLKVETPDGKLLTQATDQGDQADPSVTWTATADGIYQILVEDQFHRGGPYHHYVLETGPAAPACALTLPERAPLNLERGKEAKIKVNAKFLNGFKAPVVLRVSGLPAGVHAGDVSVPPKGGDVEIKLEVATNAAAFTTPVSIQGWTTSADGKSQLVTTADYPLRGDDARGTTLLDRASWLWLRLPPQSPPAKAK